MHSFQRRVSEAMKLLCITPNPALDRTLTVSNFRAGDIFRTSDLLLAAGGKGLNVARAARILGADPLCVSPLGGHTGRQVAELAEAEGMRGAWTWFEGETRTCTIIVDEKGATVINETGGVMLPEVWGRFQADVLAQAALTDTICLSGSFPPGITETNCAELIRALVATGKPVWVDSSNMALRAALSIEGVNIKVNDEEIGAVLGNAISGVESAVDAASRAHQQTHGAVVVTLGRHGAVMVSGAGRFCATPPELPIKSPVGSGDSFLAGLAVTGATLDGLRRAVAAGTANALTVGGGSFSLEDFERVLAAVQTAAV
jgi:1-phosphofructokinase family hexose kinase